MTAWQDRNVSSVISHTEADEKIQARDFPVPRGARQRIYSSPASENGYRDGLDAGRKDARNRDRFAPERSSRYRSADHNYNRRYGAKDDYKREYRVAFQRGYEDGFTGGRL